MKYYEVIISQTSKVAGKNQEYQRYQTERKQFGTLAEVKGYLSGNTDYGYGRDYRGHKREKMYIDDKDGNVKHVGYIYSWTEKGSVQGDTGTYYMRDWVEVREVKATPVLVKI